MPGEEDLQMDKAVSAPVIRVVRLFSLTWTVSKYNMFLRLLWGKYGVKREEDRLRKEAVVRKKGMKMYTGIERMGI